MEDSSSKCQRTLPTHFALSCFKTIQKRKYQQEESHFIVVPLLEYFFFVNKNRIIHLNLTVAKSRQESSRQKELEALNNWIIEGIRDKKGKNIVLLDLRHLEDAPADFFIICEGDSNVHVKAIADSIHKRVKEETGSNPVHTEGSMNARWVLMDYFGTVVHVFYPETRLFYELEQLWSDAKVTEFADI